MTKPRSAASDLVRKRWAKTQSPEARRAALAPASAARWPRCSICGKTEAAGHHETDDVRAHYFEPKEK